MKKIGLLGILATILWWGCQENDAYKTVLKDPDNIHHSMKQLSDVIVHDIFSPPVASRIYTYPSIAAYEAMLPAYPNYRSLAGQLNGLTPTPKPDSSKTICFEMASIEAFLKIGTMLIFSEDKMHAFQDDLYAKLKPTMPSEVWTNSIAYGDEVAAHIKTWMDKDNYKETRTFPKFSINDEPSRWKPTPPAYMDGIEPAWAKIRTMVIDSAGMFKPAPPPPFDMKEGSPFRKYVDEVYQVVKEATPETRAIASFWDCNPYVSHQTGHVMFATKKITPGGHWIGITNIACHVAKADFPKTVEAYAMTSICLFDGFISCWDEKYRSNLIRPETVINQYMDENWVPVLQTPPFPEHTSGHSVISTAAATGLTSIFGTPFSYTDSVEVEYGLEPRHFNAFLDASSEAAISRLYGGIHYMPAIEFGVDQGKEVGNLIVSRLEMERKG
ncbi:MAG: vanadium-dependent haloperoxidase [Saprospiraceae bacterium]|nr:vanadium-dependent haloperoxidase [Saprospiraceae bacterium]